MQTTEDSRIRFIYPEVNGENTINLIGVSEDFKQVTLKEVSAPAGKQPFIRTIDVNVVNNFDVTEGSIKVDKIIDDFYTSELYTAPERVFVYSDGDTLDISYIFINKLRKSKINAAKNKFGISAISKEGNQVPLFAVPSKNMTEEDMHLINFEVERLLWMYDVEIIDEDDMKSLYSIAIDYVNSLKEG